MSTSFAATTPAIARRESGHGTNSLLQRAPRVTAAGASFAAQPLIVTVTTAADLRHLPLNGGVNVTLYVVAPRPTIAL